MSEEAANRDWENTPPGCTHRCLKPKNHITDDHYEPHFYGYQLGPHAADDFLPEGYAVVKIGEVPPWMQKRHEPCFDMERDDWTDGDCYRLKDEGDS